MARGRPDARLQRGRRQSEKAAVAATGGTYVPNPIWTELIGHDLITVHPLGGCGMADDAARGVVDADCRVFAGKSGAGGASTVSTSATAAIMPRSLGVNPLLTIAAVTERAMIRLAAAEAATSTWPRRRSNRARTAAPTTIGVRFTEKMGGTLTAATGGEPSTGHFVVTVIAPDADRLLRESAHEADLIGTVHVAAVSSDPLTVERRTLQPVRRGAGRASTKQMEYRMPLTDADGTRFHFFGRKLIHDDPGFDLWSDTTTLLRPDLRRHGRSSAARL